MDTVNSGDRQNPRKFAKLHSHLRCELIKYIIKISNILKIPAIYVSHSIPETFMIGDRVHFIKNGGLVYSGNRDSALYYYNKNNNSIFKDSYIKGKVIDVDLSDGLTKIKLGSKNITVFSSTLHLGQKVIVKIKSTDIIISQVVPDKISSLNYIHTKVDDVIQQKGLVCLILNFEKNIIKAHLTKKSFIRLKIKKGSKCYAIIKALNINDVINISMV